MRCILAFIVIWLPPNRHDLSQTKKLVYTASVYMYWCSWCASALQMVTFYSDNFELSQLIGWRIEASCFISTNHFWKRASHQKTIQWGGCHALFLCNLYRMLKTTNTRVFPPCQELSVCLLGRRISLRHVMNVSLGLQESNRCVWWNPRRETGCTGSRGIGTFYKCFFRTATQDLYARFSQRFLKHWRQMGMRCMVVNKSRMKCIRDTLLFLKKLLSVSRICFICKTSGVWWWSRREPTTEAKRLNSIQT